MARSDKSLHVVKPKVVARGVPIKAQTKIRPYPPALSDQPSIFTNGPKGDNTQSPSPNQAPPGWPGTDPEWMVYDALTRAGKMPNVDFTYQSAMLGGRQELGGLVADFVIYDPPIALNVQGTYYHYDMGEQKQALDEVQRAEMTALGYTVVYLDETDVMSNVDYYVDEALKGHDHSQSPH